MRSVFIKHKRIRKEFPNPSLTKQSFREESEINNILAKYQKTGLIEHVAKHSPKYGELPDQAEFETAMNIIATANSMFEELPSSIRSRFENDAGQFLDFVSDENNIEELVTLGILDAPEAPPEPLEPSPGPADPVTPKEPEPAS